jgi:hypothetical protein
LPWLKKSSLNYLLPYVKLSPKHNAMLFFHPKYKEIKNIWKELAIGKGRIVTWLYQRKSTILEEMWKRHNNPKSNLLFPYPLRGKDKITQNQILISLSIKVLN